MKTTVYLSRKLLNQLKVKETESKDLMLTHNLHNIIINGKRVGCSGHIQNVLNNKCVYVSTEKSCYQPLSDKNLVRYAASMKDYSSVSLGAKGRNQFVTNDELDCQCHYNSARLWYKNKDRCFIATGYALSEDGLWRCHSWVVQPMARTVRVWETTVKRVAYFGVVLTSEECEDFVENNT